MEARARHKREHHARRRARSLALALACAPVANAQVVLLWSGPQNRHNGACRVIGDGKGNFTEIRNQKEAESAENCQEACSKQTPCKGYEYVRSGAFSKCEIHYQPITHVLPMSIATCRLKPEDTSKRPRDPSFKPAAYTALPALDKCLQGAVQEVHFRWSAEWERAKQCRNRRNDIVADRGGWPNPLAVVRAKSALDVSAAVKCVRRAKADMCARAGAHSFENEGCCPGGVIVDVQDLLEFSHDHRKQIVTFGSGFTNGALYYHLNKLKLAFPGGTEGHVGVSGLVLGCGRGMLTSIMGLSCDVIKAIDYVDAEGTLKTAAEGSDVLWMAKGAGGNIPAIVTAFHSKALPEPDKVHGRYCRIGNHKGERIIKAWSDRIGTTSDPEMKMFSHITTFSKVDSWMFDNLCFDCNALEKQKFNDMIDETVRAAGGGHCWTFDTSWLDKVLAEPGIAAVGNPEALLHNGEWPSDHSDSIMGSWMVPYGMDETRLHEEIHRVFKRDPPPGGPYTAQLYLYSVTGRKVTEVPHASTAYGGRSAKYVLHWRFFSANNDAVRDRHNEFNRVLGELLPCKSFYNYIDGDTNCQIKKDGRPDKDAWLDAFFSDVSRMKTIKKQLDPDDVFRSHLKAAQPLSPNGAACNGLPSCTDAVLSAVEGGHSCADRISWLMQPVGTNRMPMGETSACNVVASQFPACQGCKQPHLPSTRTD